MDRKDIADYVDALFLVYLILIFVRILLSWIPRMPYNPVLTPSSLSSTTSRIPICALFRRILPPVAAVAWLSISAPSSRTIVLYIVRAIVVGAIDPG